MIAKLFWIRKTVPPMLSVLVIVVLDSLMPGPRSAYGSGSPDLVSAVNEFSDKESALWQQRRQGKLSAEQWDVEYRQLLESETKRMQGMMPGILEVLRDKLQYRSESDRRFDEESGSKHPADEELPKNQPQTGESTRQIQMSRCGIALLTGYLGRIAPKESVEVLLSSAPPPERSEDFCFVRALMSVGPDGYVPIRERIANETDSARLYIGVMALVAPTIKTEFPTVAGIGNEEEWDKSFPKSRRSLRKLATKWEKWWVANENRLAWNPDTALLVAK
jgi:hypothetical protein